MKNEKYRPLGVTLVSILAIIGGIAFLGIGTILIVIGIGLGFVILGIAYFVMAYGLWNGRRLGLDYNSDNIWNRSNSGDCFNYYWKFWVNNFYNYKFCDYILFI